MSKTTSNKESDIFKRARSSQKQKSEPTTKNDEQASMAETGIAAVLKELKTLCAEFSGFGSNWTE